MRANPLILYTLTESTIMSLTDLQHQLMQTAEATSTLFIYLPILVLAIPLLLLYLPLRSLRLPASWVAGLFHGPIRQ